MSYHLADAQISPYCGFIWCRPLPATRDHPFLDSMTRCLRNIGPMSMKVGVCVLRTWCVIGTFLCLWTGTLVAGQRGSCSSDFDLGLKVCVCVCACARVGARAHACVYGVYVCVRACMRACVDQNTVFVYVVHVRLILLDCLALRLLGYIKLLTGSNLPLVVIKYHTEICVHITFCSDQQSRSSIVTYMK